MKVSGRSVDENIVPNSVPLGGRLQHYAWGSRSLLAGLRGDAQTPKPEAELWFGAHRSAPSLLDPQDGSGVRGLDKEIESNPALLGSGIHRRYGQLPFLLKLLAAERPLSLQAHPTLEAAKDGYAAENAAGVGLSDPTRNYRDENHKPELICALTPFRALSGFRDPATTADLLESLDIDLLGPFVAELRSDCNLVEVVEKLLSMPGGRSRSIADAVAAVVDQNAGGRFASELGVARRIAETNPGDIGIVTALMLELVTLRPGDAIYLGAGRLHAYIDGLGVEIMAASDNVMRGGMTPKHVDVAELVSVLDDRVEPIEVLVGVEGDDREFTYQVPVPDFLLSRIEVAGQGVERAAQGPEILVVTAGEVEIDGVSTAPTSARFVPDGAGWVASGRGQLFRARVGSDSSDR